MTAPLRILSLGAGVQSTTVALMSAEGELPHLDGCIFADTGWEPVEVYRHLDWLEAQLATAGIPVYRVSVGNIRQDALDPNHRWASMPLYVRLREPRWDAKRRRLVTKGMIRRQCTSEYKIKPIERKLRELVGLKPRQRSQEVLVEQWLGISYDETQRMRDASFRWIAKRYPLVDLRIDRRGCERWLARRRIVAPRSACVGCPFRRDHEWRHLRDTDPQGWADAVEFDHAIRSGNIARAGYQQLLGEAYLHESLLPLDEIDLRTPEEKGQLTLAGLTVVSDDGCGVTCIGDNVPVGFDLLSGEVA